MKKNFAVNKLCKPLEKGNSEPFYKYIRRKQKDQHPIFSLKLSDGSLTSNNLQCAEGLNEYFHSQFWNTESISNLPLLPTDNNSLEINPDGIVKLIHDIQNTNFPDLTVWTPKKLCTNSWMVSIYILKIYRQRSVTSSVEICHSYPYTQKGNRKDSCNYRPISLMSVPRKMLQHVVLYYLNQTVDAVPYNRQYSRLSCKT